jgi:UDP-N-acetyl-D-mannosaminuronic acid dehydrogenase
VSDLYAGSGGSTPEDTTVAVYGLGKMGLPLAAAMADATGDVIGVDVDEAVVRTVSAGECHVNNEPGLPDLVEKAVARDRLDATTDGAAAAASAAVHVIVVPTTLDAAERPDLSTVEAVLEAIAEGLGPGDTVVVESTVPPGTCRDVVEPRLAAESGLDPGAFGVAFCPERTSSGRALRDIRGAYPKVVGATDPATTRAVSRLYRAVTDAEVITVSDATTAEAVKLFEGAYRDVNIALANELGRASESLGIDGREAIAVANTQPYCDVHDPGPGVGGHCIPYYPHFLMDEVESPTPLLRTGRRVNEAMPAHTAARIVELLRRDGVPPAAARVALLGVTYRPGVAETTHTPTRPLAQRLDALGVTVLVADPLVSEAAVDGMAGTWVRVDDVLDRDPDLVAIVTPHEAFETLDWGTVDATVLDARDGVDAVPDAPTIGDGTQRRVATEEDRRRRPAGPPRGGDR